MSDTKKLTTDSGIDIAVVYDAGTPGATPQLELPGEYP
jgi:hypothetical protein